MRLLDEKSHDYIEMVIEMIESGEELLLILSDKSRHLVNRECTNDKYATRQNCSDGEIDTFHVFSEIESLLEDANCYSDVSVSISVK